MEVWKNVRVCHGFRFLVIAENHSIGKSQFNVNIEIEGAMDEIGLYKSL